MFLESSQNRVERLCWKDGLVQPFLGKAALKASSATLSSCISKAFFDEGLTLKRLFQHKVAPERNP